MSGQNHYGLPDPQSSPELFEGLLKRRVFAYLIDLVILSIIVMVVFVLSLFSALIAMPLLLVFAVPLSVVGYYGLTLGSTKRATIGMGIMDIVLTPVRKTPLNGWRAFAHPMVFWLTCWILPISLFVVLFTPRRQMLHDLIVGVLMVRRSPMEQRWANQPI